MTRTALSNHEIENEIEAPTILSGKLLAEANKTDIEITSLIKKDITRTLPELPVFHDIAVSQSMQQILYIWAKENPEYKYQQGMNDILAIVVVCLLSDTLVRELPTHFDEEADYDSFVNKCTNANQAGLSFAANKSVVVGGGRQNMGSFTKSERFPAQDNFTEGSFCQSAHNMSIGALG